MMRPPPPHGSNGESWKKHLETAMTVNEIRALRGHGPVKDGERKTRFSHSWGRMDEAGDCQGGKRRKTPPPAMGDFLEKDVETH